ncbi:lipase [Lacinutrix sp. WUR7]|uniref:lipase family protein n=1 Tax=Lacinutrix sp. WUR7 TaxID=2653681 RepID=UPI00193E9923|nr:lipase family protein [Lacinutrix sp. WUR7]QRM88606.1 lipase [Lacinutrix sp. WUR7]
MKKGICIINLLLILIVFLGCEKDDGEFSSQNQSATAQFKSSVTVEDGITSDFQSWLQSNGYGSYDFLRNDLEGGSFGGKINMTDQIINQPVIFIHGNSDKALGDVFGQSGWTDSRDYFVSQGYSNAELYGFTWGPADVYQAGSQYHSYAYLSQIRAFIQAVKAYTGASKVDIIGHSMGVTLGRKAVKGGGGYDAAIGNYNLGNALTSSVDTFVGIAGANQGLVSCYQVNGGTLTCDNENGLYPGYLWWGFGPYGVSDYLVDINSTTNYEGDYIYSIWSSVDEIIGYGNLVYGQYTSRIPGQDGEKKYSSIPYGHFNVKDMTEAVQYQMVKNHYIP